jgi:hypothetical protein
MIVVDDNDDDDEWKLRLQKCKRSIQFLRMCSPRSLHKFIPVEAFVEEVSCSVTAIQNETTV